MAKQQETGLKPPSLEHMGILVKDIDRALEYYGRNFGPGWDHLTVREVALNGFTYRGQLSSCRLKVALACPGPVVTEIFQLLEGDSTPYSGFLDTKSEFLHHMGFAVNDLDNTMADLARKGVKPLFYYSAPERGVKWVYIDTPGGIIYELKESKLSLLETFSRLPRRPASR